MRITRYCYIQVDRTNQPCETIYTLNLETVEKTIESCYPEHAPIEKYSGWGKDNVYIGGLGHTFLVLNDTERAPESSVVPTDSFFASLLSKRPDTMRLKSKEQCTNTSWRFGGWTGTVTPFLLDGIRYELRCGQTYFQHSKPSPYFMVVSYDMPAHFKASPEAFIDSV